MNSQLHMFIRVYIFFLLYSFFRIFPAATPKSSAPLLSCSAALPASSIDDSQYTKTLLEHIDLLLQHKFSAKIFIGRIFECLDVLPKINFPIQAMIIHPDSRLFVIGDIHSSLDNLFAQIQKMREKGCFVSNTSLMLKPHTYLICTGDFVDRGMRGTEVLTCVMGLKVLNPKNVFLCRGNHEIEQMADEFGFLGNKAVLGQHSVSDLGLHFSGKKDFEKVRASCICLFAQLPLAVFLGIRNPQTHKLSFGMYNHGGIDRNIVVGIVDLLNKTAGAIPEDLITISSYLNIHSGLLWTDYIAGSGVEEQESSRGGLAKSYCLPAAREYFSSLERRGHNYSIAFQARGHQHMFGGVCVLNSESPDARDDGFVRLKNDVPVTILPDKQEIFTFMALELAPQEVSLGLGEFNMSMAGEWVLVPTIMNRVERDYGAAQFRVYFNSCKGVQAKKDSSSESLCSCIIS